VKSTNGILITLLFLAAAGGAAVAWHEYQEIQELRAAALRVSDTGALDRQAAARRLKELSDEIAGLKGRIRDEAPAAVAQDGSSPADGAARRPRAGAGFMAVMSSPQFQRLMAIQQKGMLDGVYAPLFKALNLSPQQLDQFKNLMVQRQQAAMDAIQAAREQGINPRSDPAAFQQAVAQAQATVDSQIQAALGDSGYAQYQQYQATLPQRSTVNQLEQSLSYTATPLTDDQASQLIQILAQASPSSGSSAAQGNPMAALFPGGGPMGGGGARITQQAVTLAQGVLSAPQVQALQQLQQQQLVRQQMQQLMRAGRGGG
jgi:hypothetical protein